MQHWLRLLFIPMVLIGSGSTGASPPPTAEPPTQPYIIRKLQYPLKDRRTLFSDNEIRQARANIARYPAAKAVADSIIKVAAEWAAWSDADFRFLIPDARVPRAFDVSAEGCPKCGKKLFEKFGVPGWVVDPKKPYTVKCPNCDTIFPSNDFAAYYRSGFKDKVSWDTPYMDDGWGWVDPKTGERYWFVAHANHWTLHGRLMHVMHCLGRAYLLTGDERYAHKAMVALERFADVYPAMDHEPQS